MPMDKADYPADWPAISRAIRERAGQRCEWCGVPNGETGARDSTGRWRTAHQIDSMSSDWGYEVFGEYPDLIRIVLTVAHLGTAHADGSPGDKHDKADCRPENLAALCQRCHLNFDRAEHMAHAAVTRRKKKLARDLTGPQLPLGTLLLDTF